MPDAWFPASYDRTTKIISTMVCVLILGIAIISRNAVVGAVGLATILVSYGLSPRGYAIANRTITVKRLLKDIEISLEGAREIRAAGRDDLKGCFRLWGSGGLFGYYGLFRTSRLGNCTWYVTARHRPVILVTETKTILLSPDDVDGFLAAMRSEVPMLQQPATPTAIGPVSRTGMWIGLGVGAAVLTLVAAAMTYSPGPPKFTLSDDTLAIHDRFYAFTLHAADADVSGIRVIDVRRDPEWHITARTNGFSNAHYHSGWYRVASGAKVRMYRADATRLVLIPPAAAGAPLLLEAEDPDAFAAELRRRWGKP
ncbi:MAG: PH domain-containing protein [Acidobacteriales bacterium]|nr:PH domain-containing protein [Terriglobales bacterium]